MSEEHDQRLGRFVETAAGGETVRAYVPKPLPPMPPLDIRPFMHVYERAVGGIGQLNGLTKVLPSTPILLYMYVRKEALLSSQIEGIQSSLSDLLLVGNDDIRVDNLDDDITEVINYVDAIDHGIKRIRSGFPLSLRLIREMHEIILKSGRGASKLPGEFRRTQNWIGGTRPGNALFVPPPPNLLNDCLSDFERFLHTGDPAYPSLIRAGLAHVQFETIHPFLDGNGRVGRLLITLMLCNAEVLSEPVLYLSLYLKSHRSDYYRLLQETRQYGSWEAWMEFFLTGVAETTDQAVTTAQRLLKTFDDDRDAISKLLQPSSVLRVHEYMQDHPIATANSVATAINVTFPTARRALKQLVDLDILHEATGKKHGQKFVYSASLALLEQGTEPIPYR